MKRFPPYLRVVLAVTAASITASVVVTLAVLLMLATHPAGCRGVTECTNERRARCEQVAEHNAAALLLPVDRSGVDACTARMLP